MQTAKYSLMVVGALIIVAAAFFIGRATVDTNSSTVADLEDEYSASQEKLSETEDKLTTERGEVSVATGEATEAKEEAEEAQEELAAERSFEGKGEAQQAADQEYETDYPWGAAGSTAGGLYIVKPTAWEQSGNHWVLTLEAKNTSHEPQEPFCGEAGAVVFDAEQNTYTGQAVLGEASANCGEALQPGATATYKGEFKIPANAVPVVTAIFGEYGEEEEAKTWELPH